jgi:hypothetical protein
MKCNKNYCLFLFFLLPVLTLHAQDTHYNTFQFGARSVLMGGAVIGTVHDNTAVFYNPGALGFIDSSTLSINANAYQIDKIRIYNALGQQKDFKSSQFGSIPLLIGGMISTGKKKIRIGYAMITPVNFNFKATARIDEKLPIVDESESAGDEEFIGQAYINDKLNEIGVCLGGGYALNDKWSIGLTNILTVRSQVFERATYSRFFLNTPGNPLVSSSFVRNVEYTHIRYAAKIGVNYQHKNFGAGLTITTPSVSLSGNGIIAVDIIANNILYNGARTYLLANDRQEKIRSVFKSPVSVAAGINWNLGRSSFGIAAQYYGSIPEYDILRAGPAVFVRPASLNSSLGSDDYLRFKTAAKAVFNIALGYEYILKPTILLNASFRTNQSYYDSRLKNSMGIKSDYTTWDIYHFTAGSTITRSRSKLSIGILFSTGTDDTREEQEDNFNKPKEANFLQGETYITKATYSSIGFLVGFTLMFKKH